jgi:hypothetical protein
MRCDVSLFDIVVSECPTECYDCTGIYANEVLNSKIYCQCNCHKKNDRALKLVEGPCANAETEQPSSQSRDLTGNDS